MNEVICVKSLERYVFKHFIYSSEKCDLSHFTDGIRGSKMNRHLPDDIHRVGTQFETQTVGL